MNTHESITRTTYLATHNSLQRAPLGSASSFYLGELSALYGDESKEMNEQRKGNGVSHFREVFCFVEMSVTFYLNSSAPIFTDIS